MKLNTLNLLVFIAFLTIGTVFGISNSYINSCPLAGTPACPEFLNCPKSGQPDCPILLNCPKYGQPDCPLRNGSASCCVKLK